MRCRVVRENLFTAKGNRQTHTRNAEAELEVGDRRLRCFPGGRRSRRVIDKQGQQPVINPRMKAKESCRGMTKNNLAKRVCEAGVYTLAGCNQEQVN